MPTRTRVVDDDLTKVVLSLNKPRHAGGRVFDPNDEDVEKFLKAGVDILYEDLVAAPGDPEVTDLLSTHILKVASSGRVGEIAHKRYGSRARSRTARTKFWATKEQFGGDLVRYVFRPNRGILRVIELRSEMPDLLDAGVTFGQVVAGVAMNESDTVRDDPILAVHGALCASMAKNSMTAKLALEYYEKTIAIWGETYEMIGASYGIEPIGMNWKDVAVLFNSTADGVGIQGGYQETIPQVAGTNVLEKAVQLMLSAITQRPWDELSALTPLSEDDRPFFQWDKTRV